MIHAQGCRPDRGDRPAFTKAGPTVCFILCLFITCALPGTPVHGASSGSGPAIPLDDPLLPVLEAMAAEDTRTAEALCRELIDSGDIRAGNRACLKLAEVATRTDTSEPIRVFLSERLAAAPDPAYPGVALARIATAEGNNSEARRLLRDAIAADPAAAESFFNLADMAFRTDGPERAGREMDELAGIYPGSAGPWIGRCWITLQAGDVEMSLEAARKAVELAPQCRMAQRFLASACYYAGEYDQALAAFTLELSIASAEKNLEAAIPAHCNLVAVRQELGRRIDTTALAHTLEAARRIGDRHSENLALNGLCIACYDQGDYFAGLGHCRESIRLSESLQDTYAIEDAVHNLGNLYSEIGAFDAAARCYERSLEISESLDERRGVVFTLNSLGLLYKKMGQFGEASAYLRRALDAALADGDKEAEAHTLHNLASLELASGRAGESVRRHRRALQLFREQAHRLGEARTLLELGRAHLALGQSDTARDYLLQARETAQDIGDFDGEWQAASLLGTLLEREGRCRESLREYESAVEALERARTRLMMEEFKTGFFADKMKPYRGAERMCRCLAEAEPAGGGQRYLSLGFRFSERARARVFLDILSDSAGLIRDAAPEALRRREDDCIREMDRILNRLWMQPLPRRTRKSLHRELDVLEGEIRSLREEMFRQVVRRGEPSADTAFSEEAFPAGPIVDEGTLVLAYSLDETESLIWALSRSAMRVYSLPGRSAIEDDVRTLLRSLTSPASPASSWQSLERRVSDLLLGPVRSLLPAAESIIIIPDGILYYLPFEVLLADTGGDAPETAGEDAMAGPVVSYDPSAAVLDILRRRSRRFSDRLSGRGLSLLAAGAPHLKPPSTGSPEAPTSPAEVLAGSGYLLTALPRSLEEVRRIAGLDGFASVTMLTGPQATEAAFGAALRRSPHDIVHLATHVLVDEDFPQRSSVVFSPDEATGQDGFLQCREILSLEIDARLVVLSACQAGLGQLVQGEGMVGLTRAFLEQGCEAVIVSLWPVSDEACADTMALFYRRLLSGLSPAEALARTKSDLRSGGVPAYRHPYYWAPFILVGSGDVPLTGTATE